MARLLLSILFALTTTAAAGQESIASQDLFQRALSLHDSGDYAGAIAIYHQLLQAMPGNEQIQYELTFSTFASGDIEGTLRLASDASKKPGPYQVRYLELLGNAYDSRQQPREAIAAYKRAVRIEPKDASLRFNLGVTYAGQNQLRDAREEFERAIEIDPSYASPHYAIAETYRTDGYRVPAILAYGRFLALAPQGPRAIAASQRLQLLLNLGVTAGDKGNVNITIDPASKKDLGDFTALEMMTALASGSRYLPEKEAMSEYDREAEAFSLLLTMLSEMAGDYRRGFVAKQYVPFYAALVKAGHAATFAHLALAPLGIQGTPEWTASHGKELAALQSWLQAAPRK